MKAMDINELSEVFKTAHGYHFLEVTGRRIEDFSERFKMGQAENYLRNQKFDENSITGNEKSGTRRLSKLRTRLAVTPGEPAGIGPDICLQAFEKNNQLAELIYFVDPDLIQNRANDLKIEVPINDVTLAPFNIAAFNVHPVKASATVVPRCRNYGQRGLRHRDSGTGALILPCWKNRRYRNRTRQ